MDEQTARTLPRLADGHIDWNNARDCAAWYLSQIYLDGRFTADEPAPRRVFDKSPGGKRDS
jgi:hypothetical protein